MDKKTRQVLNNREAAVCPICESDEVDFLLKKYDDRYGYHGEFDFFLCVKCNAAFLSDKIDAKEIAGIYEKYYTFSGDLTPRKGGLKSVLIKNYFVKRLLGEISILDRVRKGARVLEIGPGGVTMDKIAVINKRKLSWFGLEVNKKCVDRIATAGLPVYWGSIDNMEQIKERFDVIVLSMSIEHQLDINVFFKNCRKALNPGGSIIFTTANFESIYRKKYAEKWINWHPPYHQILFSRKSIEMICKKFNFRINEFETTTPTSWFLLQRKFNLPAMGEKNKGFNFNFSILEYFLATTYLRLYEFLNKDDGDSMYCEIISCE